MEPDLKMSYRSISIIMVAILISGFIFHVSAQDDKDVVIETARSSYSPGDTVEMEITVNEGLLNEIKSIVLIPPEDYRAFADYVVNSSIGGPDNQFTNPKDALGSVNLIETNSDRSGTGGKVSLGGGYIILDMGQDEEIIDEFGNDLRVYETCEEYYLEDKPEPYEVYLSNNGANWKLVGEGKGVTEFDIYDAGLDSARYVKIVDMNKDTKGEHPGSDIDAVKALRFEPGHDLFAESIVDYYSGGKKNEHDNPNDVLIPGDEKYFSLGGGYIICDMGVGTEIKNKPGSDIRVYETNDYDPYSVFISQDMDEWTFVGGGMGTTEFDISLSGLSLARYIQISDGIEEEEDSGKYPGADIDGIKVLKFEKWPCKVLFNGGKESWSKKIEITDKNVPVTRTVEFPIPATLENGTIQFTVVVQYVCAKESGPGYLQFPLHGEKYFANYHKHVIRSISIDVRPEGEKNKETPGFNSILVFTGILTMTYFLLRRK